MIMRKNKQNAPQAATSDEPPFDRGFWSGKKGFAIGSSSNGGSNYDDARHQDPIFSRSTNQNANSEPGPAYPADLRRDGPFAKDRVVVPKATISQATTDQNQSGVFQPGGGVRTVGSNGLVNGQQTQKRILQLDDFEPQTKAWRRTQKEPVAPRIHPNPTPVIPLKGKAAKAAAKKAKFAAGSAAVGGNFAAAGPVPAYVAPHHTSSSDKPSIVMPLAMIFTLIVLIGGGYVYLSSLSEQNAEQANAASRERQVKLTETMLLNLGYDSGMIDGKVDKTLTDAVRAFQRDSLLQEDGRITPQLITEIEAIQKIFESS